MFASDTKLVDAFENCEFIVGSADVDWRVESDMVKNSLMWLARFACKPAEPNVLPKKNLAQTLHGMVAVAKAHYAAEGYSEYWPYLEEQLKRFTTLLGSRENRFILDGPLQSKLGDLFLYALHVFKLRVPASGQKYVGAIIFHAGLPDRSVEGLMRVVLDVVDEKNEEALRLPERERGRIVREYQPAVHRSVRSIFGTHTEEVNELWRSLVQVALAWRKSGECSIELQELPPLVNPEKVFEFLIDSDQRSEMTTASVSRPEILYDPSEGHIRIILKADKWPEPILNIPLASWKPKFRQVGNLLESICFAPLPSRFSIENPKTGAREEIHVMSHVRHGIWFDGKSGKMATADQVDRYGLTPGTWFLFILGEPSEWNVQRPIRSPLIWSFYESGRDWTAWEVEVPERSDERNYLEFRYSDIQGPVRIHLARKPGPRVEFVTKPVRCAMNATNGRFVVFSERPKVRTHANKDVALEVWKWGDSGWKHLGDLKIPFGGSEVPIDIRPGCYRLTEKRGIGREVARLAYVPELTIKEPVYDGDRLNVRIVCKIDCESGYLTASENIEISCQAGGHFEFCSTTVEPHVLLTWYWKTGDQPTLIFVVEVEGLRWRVTGLKKPNDSEHPAQLWRRDPVYLSKLESNQELGQLEIQYPIKNRLTLGLEAGEKLTDIQPAGKLWKERLRPFVDREVLLIRLDGGDPITVLVISDRLCLQSFDVEKADRELCFTFDLQEDANESNRNSLILLAWKIDDPSLSVFEHPLSNEDLENGFLLLSTDAFETHETTAFAIARKIKKGFSNKTYLIASFSLREPFGIRFEWATGDAWTTSGATPRSWEAMLLQASLEWLEGRGRRESEYREWVTMAEAEADFAWASVLNWLVDQKTGNRCNAARTLQKDAFASAWTQEISKRLWIDSCVLLQVPHQRWRDTVHHVFDQGITLGQGCPDRWKSKGIVGDDDLTVYPFQWIRDIETVSVRDWPAESDARNGFEESSKESTDRLWRTANAWGMVTLFELLPAARGKSQTQGETKSGAFGKHQHRIPFQRKIPQSVHDLRESLGIENLYLDVCTSGQLHRIPQPAWLASKSEWILEFPELKDSKCCTARELICPFPESVEIDRLKVSKWIQAWSLLDASNELDLPDTTLNYDFKQLLRPDHEISIIQDSLLPDLHLRTHLLYGQQVTVPLRTDSSPKAQMAWRMAWIERSLAFENRCRPAFGGGHQGLSKELLEAFQRQLARSIKVWPELMKRTIALAEFLIIMYRTEGIGRGFRQTKDYTQLITDQKPKKLSNPITSTRNLVELERRPITNVMGAILSYDPKRGFAKILVKHKSHVSIQAAWTQYRSPNADKKPWLAYFTIKEIQASEKKRIARAGIPELKWQGLIVKCQLVKSDQWHPDSGKLKWWAEDVHFLANFDRCE